MNFSERVEISGTKEELCKFVSPVEGNDTALYLINAHLSRLAITSCSRMYENLATLVNCRLEEPRFVNKGFMYNASDSVVTRLSREEEYRAWIAVRLYVDNARVHLEVEDNGTGIDEEIEELLFAERLRSTKRFPEPLPFVLGGSGAHLQSSKRKIDELQGRIGHINKGQNWGALFWYEIPLENIMMRK